MEDTIVLSRNALFASCLFGIHSYQHAESDIIKDFERKKMAFRCNLILPRPITSDHDKILVLWVQLMANLTDNIEIEAEAMQALRDVGEFKHLTLDVSKINIMDGDAVQILTALAMGCGVTSLKEGFDELEMIEGVRYAN